MMNGLSKSGSCRTSADVRAFLRASKVAAAADDHRKDSHLSNCQRGSDVAISADELHVAAREFKKSTDCARRRPGAHCLHLVRIHSYSLRRDDMPQVGHRRCAEGAFASFHRQAMFPETAQDGVNML
jgi:hypothetical protein